MYQMGLMLERGLGVEPNLSMAADWYRQAAAGGLVEAKVNFGFLLATGRGVESPDPEQANLLFQEAIAGGSKEALPQMGLSYFRGRGVVQNTATGLSYCQRAADQGDAEASMYIGEAYWQGGGGYDVNLKLAKKYMKAGAAQGVGQAIAFLKEMTACAQCGTGSAPRVCAGCKQVHYCNTECQLLHWRDPSDPHEAHCCSCRRDDSGASSEIPPAVEKKKSDRSCAACGAQDAKMLCSDCLYGEVPLKVRWGTRVVLVVSSHLSPCLWV